MGCSYEEKKKYPQVCRLPRQSIMAFIKLWNRDCSSLHTVHGVMLHGQNKQEKQHSFPTEFQAVTADFQKYCKAVQNTMQVVPCGEEKQSVLLLNTITARQSSSHRAGAALSLLHLLWRHHPNKQQHSTAPCSASLNKILLCCLWIHLKITFFGRRTTCWWTHAISSLLTGALSACLWPLLLR